MSTTAKADLYAQDLSHAQWRKSPYSVGEGQCVEIADLPGGGVALRDSKNTHLPALRYTAEEWQAFRRGVIDGAL